MCIWDLFLSGFEKQQREASRKIDLEMKKIKKKEKKEIKLLLLGTGESGKSTFIRQMRIIYDHGYSDEDKRSYVKLIKQNILSSMQTMVRAMSFLKIRYERKVNEANANIIETTDSEPFSCYTEMYLQVLKELWNDAGIQECYRRRREYQLTDSIKYYLDNIDRIADTGYMPTDADILRMRVPTTGLVEYNFKVENIIFRMMDVGGQRSERKKWMHCFDNVKAIIFLVAISEYDQVLLESDKRNRLIESKDVFQTLCKYEWFKDTSIVVFFNKIDLLEEKIKYSDLASYFSTFQGPKCDHLAARQFIAKMFMEDIQEKRRIYKHFTCATDTKNIEVVFAVVRDAILNENMTYFGLF